jgi:hypothetical protein
MFGWLSPATAIASRLNGVGCEVCLEPFDGDFAIEIDVGSDPDLGHSALSDPTLELVSAREKLTNRSG